MFVLDGDVVSFQRQIRLVYPWVMLFSPLWNYYCFDSTNIAIGYIISWIMVIILYWKCISLFHKAITTPNQATNYSIKNLSLNRSVLRLNKKVNKYLITKKKLPISWDMVNFSCHGCILKVDLEHKLIGIKRASTNQLPFWVTIWISIIRLWSYA